MCASNLGHYVPMVMLIGLAFVTEEYVEIAVLLLTIAVGFNSATYVGYLINHMDLSPNFAGTLVGITNSVANFVSIFAPLFVGVLVSDEVSLNFSLVVCRYITILLLFFI